MTTIERKNVAPPARRSAPSPAERDTRARTKAKDRTDTADAPDRAQRTKTPPKGTKAGTKTPPKAEPGERKRAAKEPKATAPKAPVPKAPKAPRRPRTRRETESSSPASTPSARAEQTARPRPSSGRPRAPFVLLILCLLGGALVSLLVLNTVLARDAYTLSALERSERQFTQQKQALTEEIAREEAPGRLALKARNQGMVQPSEPAFIDPGNGRVTGEKTVRPVPSAAAAAAGIIGVPGAVVPGDGIPGWKGTAGETAQPQQSQQSQQTPRPQQSAPAARPAGTEPESTP